MEDVERAQELIETLGEVAVLAALDDPAWMPDDLLKLSRAAAANPRVRSFGMLLGEREGGLAAAVARLDQPPAPAGPGGKQLLADGMGSGLQGAQLVDLGRLTSDPVELERLLSQPCELLFLVGHGNGLDVGAGGLSLCRRTMLEVGDEQRVFPCFHGEPCCRPGQAHMDPDSLGARRIIAATCWGIYPGHGHFAPEASPGRSWLANEAIEAVLTTARVTIFHVPDLDLLYYLANAGLPFGVVANEVNRYRLRAGCEADFICFGDPESRLGARVARLPSDWSDGAAHAELPAGAGDYEIRVPAAGGGVARYVVLQGEAAAWVSGVYDLRGTIYLTSSYAGPAASLGLRCSPVAELPGCGAQRTRLVTGAATVGALLASVVPKEGAGSIELMKARGAARRLSALLADWPLDAVPPGSCLTQDYLERLSANLRLQLDELSKALVALFAALAPSQGSNHMRGSWLARASFARESRRAGRCEYCGGQIDIAYFSLAGLDGVLRGASHCQACGPICDGDPALAAFLSGPFGAGRGGSMCLSVAVTNSHRLALEAYLHVVLEGFDRRRNVISDVVTRVLAPGETARLAVSLAVPADWPPGVCYAGAAIALGAQVTYLRRGVMIADPA